VPEYRQRGVGSAMMTWPLARMRARGWQVTAMHSVHGRRIPSSFS